MPSIVVGTDNVVPIYQPTARWCWWGLHEIFMGQEGAGKYVPKLHDYVMDYENYITYRVDSVDENTLLSVLVEVKPYGTNFTLSVEDVLFGTGPGTQADTYRVYYDKKTLPYTLTIDQRLKVGGTKSRYAKLFKGSDVSGTGQVISMLYDQNDNFVSNNIPLELSAIDGLTNHAIRTPAVSYTTANLINGELVTCVVYDDAGHVCSKRQLLIEETSFIRSVSASTKYISHIALDTPFMSTTTDHLIEFPINILVQSMNLMGVVYYSDGSTKRSAVDGSKFKVFGLDQFVASVVGQKIELVLCYTLDPDEVAVGGVTQDNNFVTEPYEVVTTAIDGSYSPKLYGFPVWVNSAVGYRMEWKLYNLDRSVVYDVTPYVTFNENTGPFDPKAYGYLQRLSVSINLADVSGTFKSFIHTQSIDVYLKRTPTTGQPTADLWQVGLSPGNNNLMYGSGLYCTATNVANNNWNLNVMSGITTKPEWIERAYNRTYPLLNPMMEIAPVVPTHMNLYIDGVRHEFPINSWNINLNVTNSFIADNKTIFIEFFKRGQSNDMQLACGAMPIRVIT